MSKHITVSTIELPVLEAACSESTAASAAATGMMTVARTGNDASNAWTDFAEIYSPSTYR